MSSALAVVLAAGMALGDGPAEVGQGPDLRGEWKGTLRCCNGRARTVTAVFEDDKLTFAVRHENGATGTATFAVINEGGGRLRLASKVSTRPCISRQEGDSLTPCYRKARYGRPTSFRPGERQTLVTLRRVKPRE